MKQRLYFSENKKNVCLIFILIFLTVFRIIIQLRVPPLTLAGKGVDEHLFVTQATEYIKGNWFGNYDYFTLIKNPTYSFFYVLLYKLSIPYPLGLMIVHIFSSVMLVMSIYPIVKSKYMRSIIYLFLLYTPVMLDNHFGFRLYRDALLTPLVLLVLAGVIGLFLYRNQSVYYCLGWSLLECLAFPAFIYLREDSVWLKPFIYTALLLTFIFVFFSNRKLNNILPKTLCLLLPLASLFFTTQWIIHKNEEYYGISAVNDRTKTAFPDVIADLISIDDGRSQEYVWISENTLRKAMEISPTLNQLSEHIDWLYDPDNGRLTEVEGEDQAELFSGTFVWDFRLAVARSGLGYRQEIEVDGKKEKGGKVTNEFFENIHSELSQGFENGELKKRNTGISVSKSAPSKSWNTIKQNVVPKIGYTMKNNLVYAEYSKDATRNVLGDSAAIREIEMLTNTPLNYPDGTPEAEYNKPLKTTNRIINKIIFVYKKTSPIVLLITIVGILYSFISLFKQNFSEQNIAVALISVGLLLSWFILILGVSWAYSWVSEATMSRLYYYSSGSIPVLQVTYILGGISFIDFVKNIFGKFKLKKLTSNVESDI